LKTLKSIIISLTVIILVVLIIQNLAVLTKGEVFRINLIFASLKTPPLQIYLLLAVFFVLGFALAYVTGFMQRRRLKKNIKELNRSQAQAEKELNSLRNLPITGPKNGLEKTQAPEQAEE